MNNSNKIQSEILFNCLKNIEGSIQNIEKLRDDLGGISDKISVELSSLLKQRDIIEEQINEFKLNNGINDFDNKMINVNDKYDLNVSNQNALENKINELEEQKNNLKTQAAKASVEKKIVNVKEKLDKLKLSQVNLEQRQRIMLLKKQNALNKRNAMVTKLEAKAELTQSKIDDNNIVRNGLGDSLGSKIVGKVYDLKGRFYQKQFNRQTELLNTMKKNGAGFKGANVMVVKKKAGNILRKSIKTASILKNNIVSSYNNTKDQLNQMLHDDIQVNNNSNTNNMSI